MHTSITDAALSLANGQRTRIVCPFCGGGSSKERSMLVSRMNSGNVHYMCYRATCEAPRGIIRSNGYVDTGAVQKTQGRPFLGAYTAVPDHVAQFLKQQYDISVPKDWRWSEERHRVLIPLRANGQQWGWLARGFKEYGLDGPKADIFYNKEFVGYSD